jgi:hypothetical protein
MKQSVRARVSSTVERVDLSDVDAAGVGGDGEAEDAAVQLHHTLLLLGLVGLVRRRRLRIPPAERLAHLARVDGRRRAPDTVLE